MQDRSQQFQPSQVPLTSSTYSTNETTTTETGTTGDSGSDTHSYSTGYGIVSLQSDCSNEAIGSELTLEETQWLQLAREFTAAEKPFKEQKPFRVARRLRVWHPKRGVTWTFLRRLYNGRQDMKEEILANISELSIKENK